MKVENLKKIKIFGELEGERVEITKIDFVNLTCSIYKSFMGKKIYFAYSKNDPFIKKLVLSNFQNIEIIETK